MSGRIPPELFKKIKGRAELEKTAIYKNIGLRITEYRGLINQRTAAVQYALDLGITSASKYLTPEDKDALSKAGMGPQVVDAPTRTKVVTRDKTVTIDSLRGITAFDPFLPSKLIEEATRMAEKCYPLLYVYENTIRNVVKKIMEDKYGPDWWETRVKQLHGKMYAKIEGRIKDEGDERWHSSRRGVHKIYYTDLDHLRKIIEDDWALFECVHKRKSWVVEHIMQPNHSRNIVAHNNPLSAKDMASLNIKVSEWLEQIKRIT
jgi:hypothetical protein